MADLLLPALIKFVMQKAADSLVQQIVQVWGVSDQFETLRDMLLAVQAVLADAEDKGTSNPAVRNWMLKLKSAAYDADDLLDEFCYEELRRDAVKCGHKVDNGNSIVSGGLFSLNNPALFQYKMSKKLSKVVGRIEMLVAQMERFRFVQGQGVQLVNRVGTDSLLIESNVVGREEDKENIVRLLLEACETVDFTVVPVVGMGGLGKTTLAQLVYSDPRVKEHFKLLIWVCVSEEFHINVLVKSIIDLVIRQDCKLPIDNMELLQRRLRRELSGKRYLLVLDDVWNENTDDWMRLRAMLNGGDSEGAVIVTTRSSKVASITGTVGSYNLGFLSETHSWSLFHKRAFSKGVKECKELADIGRKIVHNCQGLPLAIKALSSVMSCKHEVSEWSAVLEESNIWEEWHVKDDVLPVLKLSYDHLPQFMKQCFAFCAVFPRDYVMVKDHLIQYWMAHGFIPFDGSGSLEMKGNDIFDELVWRSFFQDVEQVKSVCESDYMYMSRVGHCSLTVCKMHDLMHDLARSIMGGECISTSQVPKHHNQPDFNVRHILLRNPVSIDKVMSFFPSIRTLIFFPNSDYQYAQDLRFFKSNALRIFKLDSVESIERTMFTPEKMKHLRCLEIAYCDIKTLPEMISTLYLLQTLRLTRCWELKKLPESLRYLRRLRHLYIEECPQLESMPSGLGELSCLQTLTTFIIGTGPGCSIAELKNLNLYGKLHIYKLGDVRDVANARGANLVTKQNLDDLLFCWGTLNDYYNIMYGVPESNSPKMMSCDPCEVLEALKPCNRLKVLGVTLYEGVRFPIWMMEYQMLENLIELYIMGCRKCTELLPVEKLPFLKILVLKHLDKLMHLCNIASTSSEGGKDTQIVFPSLEQLELYEMPKLSSWCNGETGNKTSLEFPMLKNLSITGCPGLIAMPHVPLLKKLFVKGNSTLSGYATTLTTLQDLSLVSHHGDVESESASESESISFKPWESLEELSLTGYNSFVQTGANEEHVAAEKCAVLYLESCNFVFSHDSSHKNLRFWECFTFLEYLYIGECDSLTHWPEEEFRSLNCLREIVVTRCPEFLGSRHESKSEKSIAEALLPKLQRIYISECPNLVKIPDCSGSASLQELYIRSCPKLERISEWLQSMVSLKELQIDECESFKSLPLSIGGLTNLEKLEIGCCRNLAELPEGMEGLRELKELKIQKCPKLRVLPEGLLQRLKNLDELWVKDCPYLERRFRKNRKYRNLISKIRFTVIGDSRKFGMLSDLALSISSCDTSCFSAQSQT